MFITKARKFHKSDGGIKAHLNLAVLAYWIVSVTKYRLLEVNPNPIGKVKSMVHPKAPPKNPPPENQGVM